ncbi:unnamed protein product [Lactuca saligna]|uniref:Uncharacterized protein n=1 Tax=Lactuca saligna TaxID=75948 RepID=A0AA35YU26_LACSI|nr:unnamed protein product [Lactuca saligna]
MARRTQRTNPPEDVTDHRFLQFPQTLNDATQARYVTNLSLLLTKEIDIAPSFDWELATRTGLAALIQEFLQYTQSDASGVDLFMFSYDPRKAPNERTTFAFRLGGVSRECSVIELATRVGIYTADETRSVHFPTFLADCLTDRSEDYNENTFWAEITGGVYTPSTARGRMIRSTTYRMLHRLISMSLTHHKNRRSIIPAATTWLTLSYVVEDFSSREEDVILDEMTRSTFSHIMVIIHCICLQSLAPHF